MPPTVVEPLTFSVETVALPPLPTTETSPETDVARTGASKACVCTSPLTDSSFCSPRRPLTAMSALTVSTISRMPFGTRKVSVASSWLSSSSSCRYLPLGRSTSMRTYRSVASNSSSSLGLSSSATRSTSFLSQVATSTRPCTFETSTVASGATLTCFMIGWPSGEVSAPAREGAASAASVAPARHAFRMLISGSPREAVTGGDDSRIQLQFLLVRADEHAFQHPARRVLREGGVDLVSRLLHDLEVLRDRRARLGLQARELPAELAQQLVAR